MVRTAIVRAVAHRKTEAVTIVTLAVLAAAGFLGDDEPRLPISRAVATIVRPPNIVAADTGAGQADMDLPNLDHPRIESWIRRFTTSQRGTMTMYLERKSRYENMITEKAERRGVPTDLMYLAMIESGFNPRAKSPVQARGLWQFMRPTAKQYGLRVARGVDERTSASRSTDAALRYLKALHDRFGSWYLAAAAYNTGQGRVSRVLRQETGRTTGTDADFFRIAHRLPKETRDYVPKLIAAARIGNNPAKYGFSAN